MNIYPDKIGGSVREDGAGRRVTKLYRASDVAAPAESVLVAVMNDRRIPQMGAQLRADPSLFVVSRELQVGRDANDLIVRVEYGVRTNEGSAAQIGQVSRSVRADTLQEITTTDIDGRVMQTTYLKGLSVGAGSFSISVATLVHEVEVQRPTISLSWTRLEDEWVYPAALDLSGAVNASPWLGQPRDSWLMNVRSSEQSGGRHSVEYTATLNRNGWQATITHSENGRIPLDISRSNGIEVYQVYPRWDFRRLGLPA